MELQLLVEGERFRVSVGKGYGDFVWLASYAAKLYGSKIYPKGNYLSTTLRIESEGAVKTPHPRKKIAGYLQETGLKPQSLTVVVPIRKANQALSEAEEKWQRQAYGEQRNLMELRFHYFADKLNRKKEFYFAVELSYLMYEEVKHLYEESDYKSLQEIPLKESQIGLTSSQFTAELCLPLGSAKYTLLYYSKEDKGEEFKCTRLDDNQLRQNSKNVFTVLIDPVIPSQADIQEKIKEDMRIHENLAKSLQQKEQQSQKKSSNTTLCCYTFEQLWSIIEADHEKELSLAKYQPSTIERVKVVLEKHLSKLYQVFFYYFIVYNQQKEKKEELVITYQDIMHALKFYEIFRDSSSLFNFFDFYNADGRIKNVADTVDLNNGVTFPHFLAMLLRATQFVQTSNLMMEGQTFDQSVSQVISKLVQIDSTDEQFSFFHRNLREHSKLIAFVREHSLELASIFVQQIQNGTQLSENSYHMLREQLKTLLGDCGFEGNHDNLLNQCFLEFFGSKEKYRKFQGIFFYEFIQIVEWLALVLVQTNPQEEDDDDDPQQEILALIDKMKFLIGRLMQRK